MKRQANPQLSSAGERALAQYEQTLYEREELMLASNRNDLSDLRHFIARHEAQEALRAADTAIDSDFNPQTVTTPALTRYRTYLQIAQRQKPASGNSYFQENNLRGSTKVGRSHSKCEPLEEQSMHWRMVARKNSRKLKWKRRQPQTILLIGTLKAIKKEERVNGTKTR